MTKDNTDNTKPYLVLARKYRPQSLDELIGQDVLVKVLTNAFKINRIPQAIMLTGVRGVGKTTTARILARALNYEHEGLKINAPTIDMPEFGKHCRDILASQHVDVLEMDAASNTSINDIREIIDAARYKPLSARMKVYIIDELHMLSIQAFNGLLKTLEEPPEHVKFIFATTEIHKVPVTILSRCLRFDLRRVSNAELTSHLTNILAQEKVAADDNALRIIARAAEGSVRDALSLLDQAIALSDGTITEDAVAGMIGMGDKTKLLSLFECMVTGEPQTAIATLHEMYNQGADPETVLKEMLTLTHQITRVAMGAKNPDENALTQSEKDALARWHTELPMSALQRIWQMLLKGIEELSHAPKTLDALEMLILRISHASDTPPLKTLLHQLGQLTKNASATTSPASGTEKNTHAQQPIASLAAPPPSPTPAQLPRPTNENQPSPPTLTSLEHMVARAEAEKDIALKTALKKDVHLVAIENNTVTLRLKGGADTALLNKLKTKLKEWTGDLWQVVHTDAEGAPTLEEQDKAIQQKELNAHLEHPLVKEFTEHFPNAQLKGIEHTKDIEKSA